jgi:hypothetical protein
LWPAAMVPAVLHAARVIAQSAAGIVRLSLMALAVTDSRSVMDMFRIIARRVDGATRRGCRQTRRSS